MLIYYIVLSRLGVFTLFTFSFQTLCDFVSHLLYLLKT